MQIAECIENMFFFLIFFIVLLGNTLTRRKENQVMINKKLKIYIINFFHNLKSFPFLQICISIVPKLNKN